MSSRLVRTGGRKLPGLEDIMEEKKKSMTKDEMIMELMELLKADGRPKQAADAESIKELSSKAHSDPASVSKGDIVTFTGGGVYKSSTAEYASVQKNVTSTCKVTAVNTKGTHPYHCISQDGKGVYGWVNAADVK